MTNIPRRIEDLADELISAILTFLLRPESSSNTSSPVNSNGLSSAHNGRQAHAYGEQSELGRFRLVCKRFCRISTPRKFRSFVLRFERRGFERLEELVHMQLACHVRRFTYMVRPFYKGSGNRWSELFAKIGPNDPSAVQIHKERLQCQRSFVTTDHDRALLQKAIVAFSSLQQIKLLRLQDEADEKLLDRIRERSLDETLALDWEEACARAVTNLGISLLASNCTSVSFVGPQISPGATVRLLQTPSSTLSALGARLTCLDVNFHSKADLTSHMEVLSDVFQNFFLAATNLTSLHLGFATATPLDISLEQVFHRIQWKRLSTLSIQGWCLTSQEIIALIRRHRRQLRDIRLVEVYIRTGGRWRDVLSVLHDEMDEIEHIDLRRINYTSYIDPASSVNGSNGHGNGHGHGHHNGNGSAAFHQPPSPLSIFVNSPSTPSPPPPFHQVVLNTDRLAFASRGQTRHSSNSPELERLRRRTIDELGDDGISVTLEQSRLWEKWVLSSPRRVTRRKH
ncbi:hypothetical protein BJX70DRAFT_386005 [Aspergillus crustosus]